MKWEYKTEKLPMSGVLKKTLDEGGLDATLSKLGNEGWELVNVVGLNTGFGETGEMVALFKRPQG